MVVEFYGFNIDQVALYDQLKRKIPGMPGQWGVYNNELIAAVRALGFDVDSVLFDFTDHRAMAKSLHDHLHAGNGPLIATQRAAVKIEIGHSRVVVGVEEEKDGSGPFVILHDPAAPPRRGQGGIQAPLGGSNKKWSAESFATLWKPKGTITRGGEAIWIRPPPKP